MDVDELFNRRNSKTGADYMTVVLYDKNFQEISRFVGIYKRDVLEIETALFTSVQPEYIVVWNKERVRIDQYGGKDFRGMDFVNIIDSFFISNEIKQ